ncbi:hypothetical protein [Caldiplasma sukawensis]
MSDKICDVVNCNETSVKTVGSDLASKVFTFKSNSTKVHLCREHYKKYKKDTKKERDAERAGWV